MYMHLWPVFEPVCIYMHVGSHMCMPILYYIQYSKKLIDIIIVLGKIISCFFLYKTDSSSFPHGI